MGIETSDGMFIDNSRKIRKRQNISFKQSVCIVIYYLFASKLPTPPLPFSGFGMYLRKFLSRQIFLKTGDNFKVHKGVDFGSGINIQIGENSSLNRGAWIGNDTEIGSNVMMGPEVIILSGSHNFNDTAVPMTMQGAPDRKPVVIGNDVWIGTRVIIMPGVVIADHCIIGAGAILTKNTEEWGVYGGNPARLIRYRKKTL